MCLGTNVTFSVVAAGEGPLKFQWRLYGTNIQNQTNGTLWLPNVQTAQAGNYCVVVANDWGAVTSQLARLTVLVPPSFTQTPVSQVIHSGSSATFCAAATDFPTPTYQWRFNGVNILGATGACYNMASTSFTNIGTYDVVISNSVGTNYSSAVTLGFIDLKMLAAVYLTGPVGKNYRIDTATTLAPTNWVPVTNITIPTQPFIYVDYTSATNKMQFYRAVPLP